MSLSYLPEQVKGHVKSQQQQFTTQFALTIVRALVMKHAVLVEITLKATLL